jgi:CheY-like chemotaxis protein
MMDRRTTILYVDDNPRSSRLLAGVLEQCGFHVTAKTDPADAIALCKRATFDLALLDYEMPAMSGSQLAREIKSLIAGLPIILLSGRAELPAPDLEFVDAHFGFGTSLDDLLWTMRILTTPRVFVRDLSLEQSALEQTALGQPTFEPRPIPHPTAFFESRWSDST